MGSAIDAETLELTLTAIGDFAADQLSERTLLELDARDEVPLDVVHAMCGEGLGLQLLFVPEEYGGMGGGAFDVYRVCERMARVDLGISTSVLATFLGSDPLRVGGTDIQKKEWLGRIADEGILFAYGATEPEAGSDLGALRTTATPVLQDGRVVGYRITGAKQWISNGGIADAYSILAMAPGGPSWFVVEAGADGFTHGKPEDKHGIRASNTAPLSLEDVLVDVDRLVGGEEGQGLLQAQAVFGYTRLMVAAFGLGAGWEALDRAIEYSKTRVQAGTPLAEKQGYTHKLIVPHAVRLEAARSVIEATAERIDAGEGELGTEGAVAKYLATEAGNAAADASIQALGGYGYVKEYLVEKIRRDVRITTIYEGTSEIMEMTIARDRWQEHLKSRGSYYRLRATELDALHASHPEVGAAVVASGCRTLAEVLERCRIARLTRNQHVLLRLGHLIAWVEGAEAFSFRAAAAADGRLPAKGERRFSPETLAAMARAFAREAATEVVTEGLRWVIAAGGDGKVAGDVANLLAANEGLLADLDAIADAIYGREG